MSNFVDFSKLGGPVYAGRTKGERARQQLMLDDVDSRPGVVKVKIPDGTYSLNSSFFLGLFGPSVIRLRTRDAFLEKYVFEAPSIILEEIDKGIDRALAEVRPL